MPAIGDRLREARTRRGVDFDEVEAVTKIRARYLRALESEQFDLLPGPTYVRTFLRTYAEYLGLDARLLVEEYRTQHESAGEESSPQTLAAPGPGRLRDRAPVGLGRGPGPLFLVGAGALGVILLLLVIGLVAGEQTPAPRTDPSTDRDKRGEEAPRKRSRRSSPRRRSVSTPKSVTLRVAPKEPTYVCVDDGRGQIRYEGTLAEARTFRGKRLRINMGRTSPRVISNGRPVQLDRDSADPASYDLRPGVRPKKLPSGTGPCT